MTWWAHVTSCPFPFPCPADCARDWLRRLRRHAGHGVAPKLWPVSGADDRRAWLGSAGFRLCHRPASTDQWHEPALHGPACGSLRWPARGDGRRSTLLCWHSGHGAVGIRGALHLLRRVHHGHGGLSRRDADDYREPDPHAAAGNAWPCDGAWHGGVFCGAIPSGAAGRDRHSGLWLAGRAFRLGDGGAVHDPLCVAAGR